MELIYQLGMVHSGRLVDVTEINRQIINIALKNIPFAVR